MAEIGPSKQLVNLEFLGDATQYATQLNSLVQHSSMFENFNLAEIRLLSQFMTAYRAEAEVEVIREGDAGDFMMLLLEGDIGVFKRDRWNAQRLIAVLQPGHTVGEMSMIDGEPRFATCVAEERCLVTVLSREALARIILEQPVLGAKILMELVLMLSQRLRQTSQRLVSYMDREQT